MVSNYFWCLPRYLYFKTTTIFWVGTRQRSLYLLKHKTIKKYYDAYTQFPQQFNSNLLDLFSSFAIRRSLMNLTFEFVASIHALCWNNRIERKKSKYFWKAHIKFFWFITRDLRKSFRQTQHETTEDKRSGEILYTKGVWKVALTRLWTLINPLCFAA